MLRLFLTLISARCSTKRLVRSLVAIAFLSVGVCAGDGGVVGRWVGEDEERRQE